MGYIKKTLGVLLVVITLILCVPNVVKAEQTQGIQSVMSDEFKSYLNENLEFEIRAVKPKTEEDFEIKLIAYMISNFDKFYPSVNFSMYSENFDEVELTINSNTANSESHRVKIKYIYNEEIEAKINALIDENEKAIQQYEVNDLDMIHHYYYRNKYEGINASGYQMYFIDSFTNSAKSILDNSNATFRVLAISAQTENGLKGEIFPSAGWVNYDDIVYFVYNQNAIIFNLSHILYVPDDTENTVDAIQNAAQKRINDYLQNENVKLEYVSTVEEYLQNETYTNLEEHLLSQYNLTDVSKDDYVYKVEMKISETLTNTFNIVIKRDSSKMIKTSKNVDLMTGIEVNSSTPISLDASISVNKLTSGEEYERIIRLLNITDSVSYDIKLYSKLQDKYITKLEDGTFEVKIPIPDSLVGKELSAYYVDENNNIEEYQVEIRDGYAIFKTTHFSIYTLGTKRIVNSNNGPLVSLETNTTSSIENKIIEEENPKTGDSILWYVATGVISLVGIGSIGLYSYRKKHIKVS